MLRCLTYLYLGVTRSCCVIYCAYFWVSYHIIYYILYHISYHIIILYYIMLLYYIYLVQLGFHPAAVVVIHYLLQLGARMSCSALNVPAKWV